MPEVIAVRTCEGKLIFCRAIKHNPKTAWVRLSDGNEPGRIVKVKRARLIYRVIP